jgi:Tfp pilus assembly protein PilF
MPDKKISRSGQGRPPTPTQRMEAALSDPGTVNMAESTDNKGRATLVDKFRGREERWRTEQALHEQQAEAGHEVVKTKGEEAVEPSGEAEPIDPKDWTKGGAL